MASQQRVHPLKGIVQHYSWGGFNFIPQLLDLPGNDRQPYAEYWLGAHPNHPSIIEGQGLDEFLRNAGGSHDTLPFLLKVLDVRQMLSIQVHPSKASAKKGFDAENAAGIPRNASHRNYKDDNHKPELMVALSDFYLLHGFKQKEELERLLAKVPELNYLQDHFAEKGYRGIYEEVMRCSQDKVNSVLGPLLERILPPYEKNELPKSNEHFWAARAAKTFCSGGVYDRGIFSIYLFNLLHLSEGEGIYQPASLPHAYLEGQNVEIMANSDNVLRAGLTDKHIDIEELMKHIRFEATIPNILKGEGDETIRRFAPPVEEFELLQYKWESGEHTSFTTQTPEICLPIEGRIRVNTLEAEQNFGRGEAFFIQPGSKIKLAAEEPSVLFRAIVPVGEKNS